MDYALGVLNVDIADRTAKNVVCESYGKNNHHTALHNGAIGQQQEVTAGKDAVATCTLICGIDTNAGKSCAKLLLVKVYPRDKKERSIKIYAIIDDQRNRS